MIKTLLQTRSYPHPEDAHLELVLAELDGATYRPYVVWMHNLSTDSTNHGDYYGTLAEAQAGFEQRYHRVVTRKFHGK
ncbi:MAG: hypothetical protein C7B46_17040 [Sulfobacillus benefaciens]|uniref:Uncharacterized protein n=1 Tax=Sulfobacillus benefaciens TaxID=453960 RepID=A0A2T2X9Q7_9FIRM|nr:MAG: hypothetical protein C7B46_17040 [Sulfobacillus benefaciens]